MKYLGMICFFGLTAGAAEFQIKTVVGRPSIEVESKSSQLKAKQKLNTNDFEISTDDKSEVSIVIEEKLELILLRDSILQNQVGRWFLQKGAILWKSSLDRSFVLQTRVGEIVIEKSEGRAVWDAEKASLEVAALQDVQRINIGVENPFKIEAMTYQKFQADRVNGEPAFDLLLKGKKFARGVWGEVVKIPAKDLKKYLGRVDVKKIVSEQKLKEAAVWICKKPNGQYKDCAYSMQKAKCFKSFCNAQGQWSPPEEVLNIVPACAKKSVVKNCQNEI